MTDQTTRPIVPLENPDEVLHRRQLADRVNSAFPKDGSEGMVAPAKLMSYAAADLPAAAQWTGATVYVSDEGAIAVSDGTSWIRADVSLASNETVTGAWTFDSDVLITADLQIIPNNDGSPTIHITGAGSPYIQFPDGQFFMGVDGGSYLMSTGAGAGGTFTFKVNNSTGFIAFNVNGNTEAMRIDSAAKVGIGINVPAEKLSVKGSVGVLDSGGTDKVVFSHDGTDFNIAGTNTTDINITGVTAVNVPALESSGPIKLASYTVAGVPAAASNTGAMIYVSNETGGAIPAFSDGTNWRRVSDRAVIA